ncbi:MAG: type VI secretion system ATPase TssH, partial [Planctomycetota bacterium]|nr:type VI secretion system ATPase TssH [Planctomycetota bacterium]
KEAWLQCSLAQGALAIRTGHLILAVCGTDTLQAEMDQLSGQFRKIDVNRLAEEFETILKDSPENVDAAPAASVGEAMPGESSGAIAPAQLGKQEALKKFTTDLTAQARDGELDPIVGRDGEIRQAIDILLRRRQNNPILVGEAGVGKTAVVEGLAQRIVRGDVPPSGQDVRLLTLDIGLLQAGASMKGEFESRLRQVIDEVHASPEPIILFIDEAHTLLGAGGQQGTGDAANLLKPALARGTLRTVAATTWDEYKKYIEKDPALARRFQTILVEEPSIERAELMMRGVADSLAAHHEVLITEDGIEAAVELSARYLQSRQLPDKSVSVLDTACARVAVTQHAIPPQLDDLNRRLEALEVERGMVEREISLGIANPRGEAIEEEIANVKAQAAETDERYQKELELTRKILENRKTLLSRTTAAAGDADEPADSPESSDTSQASEDRETTAAESDGETGTTNEADDRTAEEIRAELERLGTELTSVQGEAPMVLPTVDDDAVAAVIGEWTGIPVGRMVSDQVQAALDLPNRLEQRILGQNDAIQEVASRIQTAKAGLEDPGKPSGVFMLVGPSGVGKTETALTLAEILFGGDQGLITINMSEFQEAHTVSTLKGAPPGYVGYGEGGVLTEAVRRKPYSVVLLDEMEKAHKDVHQIFFQVFDKGWMEDGEGRRIDFRNTVIIMTSNVATDEIVQFSKDPDLAPPYQDLAQEIKPAMLKVFPPALLGRIVTVPYLPFTDEILGNIVRLKLDKVAARMESERGIHLDYDDAVVGFVHERCQDAGSGARMIDAILTNTLLPEISRSLLERMLTEETTTRVAVTVKDGRLDATFS